MGSFPSTSNTLLLMIAALFLSGLFMAVFAGNFTQDFDITWGLDRAKILNNGEALTLSLNKSSGSGFRSKKMYLFGNINMQLKLASRNFAGTVTTYYLWSNGSRWDEIDFGFLGNRSGDPYILHTNVVIEGNGNREQQFYLWFDPTADFHIYSILWNPQRILFAVDGAPIRVFKNLESSLGIPYPKKQPMRIYSSIWEAGNWTASSGLVETNRAEAPFTVSYRNFDADDSCVWSNGTSSCSNSSSSWLEDGFDSASLERMRWVQNNYMIYNYCNDLDRFPKGLPPECDIY